MKPVDGDRTRVLLPDGPERPAAAQRFEQALNRRRGDDAGGGGPQDDGTGSRQGGRAAQAATALSPNVMRWFRHSIERGLPDDGPRGPVLDALLEDIADGVRAGRRFSGERWRLTVRLRPEVLPLTEADIACAGGELSVALRTASEDAYRALVEALPTLDAALEERQIGTSRTTVFLIGPEELQ